MFNHKKILYANTLKGIAIIAMIWDHFVAALFPHSQLLTLWLRVPGRVAAPIMCYFIAEGYHHTSSRKKYIYRLLLLSLLSHLPYNAVFDYPLFKATSMIWSLSLGLIALTAIKEKELHWIGKFSVLLICVIFSIPANWNFIAVFWVVSFGVAHGNFKKQMIYFSLIGIVFHLIPNFFRFGVWHNGYPHLYQIGIFLAVPLLAMYNGKRHKGSSFSAWFSYGIYPLHLIIIFWLKKYTILQRLFLEIV